jgi:2'-5' RNA ligase
MMTPIPAGKLNSGAGWPNRATGGLSTVSENRFLRETTAPPGCSAVQCALPVKRFRAHVTLVRKVPHGSHDHTMQSVLWSFNDCALIDSRTGPVGLVYSILGSWSLCTEVRKMPEKKDK